MFNLKSTLILLILSSNAYSDHTGSPTGSRKELIKKNNLHSDFDHKNKYRPGRKAIDSFSGNNFSALPPEAVYGYSKNFKIIFSPEKIKNLSIKIENKELEIIGAPPRLERYLKKKIILILESNPEISSESLTEEIDKLLKSDVVTKDTPWA